MTHAERRTRGPIDVTDELIAADSGEYVAEGELFELKEMTMVEAWAELFSSTVALKKASGGSIRGTVVSFNKETNRGHLGGMYIPLFFDDIIGLPKTGFVLCVVGDEVSTFSANVRWVGENPLVGEIQSGDPTEEDVTAGLQFANRAVLDTIAQLSAPKILKPQTSRPN